MGPPLAILLFAVALCSPVLIGKVPIASDTLALWAPWSQTARAAVHNVTLADSVHLYLAWTSFARGAIAGGEWPMWDPFTFSGYPFAANAQNHVYYPLTWLLWAVPLSLALQLQVLFNICLAGWGMYAFVRVLGVSRPGALISGLAFAGSGMLQTALDLPFIACAYGWLPWMLLCTEQALRLRSGRWTAAAVLTCGLQLVSGNLQWAVYAYFATACWIVFRSIQFGRPEGWRHFGRGVLILAAGAALAAVHLVPFFELMALAGRTGARASSNSDPMLYLLRLALPGYFGSPTAIPNYPLNMNVLWYVGLSTLILAAGAVLLRPRPLVWFWVVLPALAVLVTYGIGPFLWVRWLPGLSATIPSRIGFLFIVGLSVLAGLGFDAWVAAGREHPHRAALTLAGLALALAVVFSLALDGRLNARAWALRDVQNTPQFRDALLNLQASELLRGGLFAFAALLALALLIVLRSRVEHEPQIATGARLQGPLRGVTDRRWTTANRLLIVAFCLILATDLWSAVPGYNTYASPDQLAPTTPALEWLRSRPGEWRLMGLDSPTPSFVPNTGMLFALPSVAGYDSLHPRRYDEFWWAVDPSTRPKPGSGIYGNVFVRPQAYTTTLASLLNVTYVATSGNLDATAGYRQVYTGEVNIYENANVLPRAFLVEQAAVLAPEHVQAMLSAPGFDPRVEVLLEKSAPGFSTNPESGKPGEVRFTSYRRNSVSLDADLSRPAWLVLSDAYYPGWQALVDGREQEIYVADHVLRAVPLQPGRHRVTFSYLPSYFLSSLLVSLITLGIVLAALMVRRKPDA